MTTIARRVASVPVRTSVETWQAICALLAQPGTAAHGDLTAVSSIAAVLIAEEYTSAAPVIVTAGGSPRLRVDTVHGDDAPDAEADEEPLPLGSCENDDWAVSLPCAAVDLAEITSALDGSTRFTVRDLDEGIHLVKDRNRRNATHPAALPSSTLRKWSAHDLDRGSCQHHRVRHHSRCHEHVEEHPSDRSRGRARHRAARKYWAVLENGVSTWLGSGHLKSLVLEVFDPTLTTGKDLVGRFDFVIDYGYYGDGNGELWLDPDTVSYAVRKNGSYPSRCSYRLVVDTLPGEPAVPGWSDTTFRSTDELT